MLPGLIKGAGEKEIWQWLENVARIHLVLASGEQVLQKKFCLENAFGNQNVLDIGWVLFYYLSLKQSLG